MELLVHLKRWIYFAALKSVRTKKIEEVGSKCFEIFANKENRRRTRQVLSIVKLSLIKLSPKDKISFLAGEKINVCPCKDEISLFAGRNDKNSLLAGKKEEKEESFNLLERVTLLYFKLELILLISIDYTLPRHSFV